MLDTGSVSQTGCRRPIPRRQLAGLAAALACALVSPLAPALPATAKNKKKKRKTKKDKNKSKRNNKNKNRKKNKQKSRGSSQGQAIVSFAQKYKGTRYVWGGSSPKGFDCSGFTWFVYDKVTGTDIGRTEDVQWKHGRSVSRGAWQAGDLVFFENTFERGLSHVGIYMSGDNFIHAENESTGVVVSSLSSDYYQSHYAGARRLV